MRRTETYASPRSIIRPGFRLRPVAALTGAIALVTAVAACGDGPSAPVLEDDAALVLGVEAGRTEILPGDTVWVTVRAENPTAARSFCRRSAGLHFSR